MSGTVVIAARFDLLGCAVATLLTEAYVMVTDVAQSGAILRQQVRTHHPTVVVVVVGEGDRWDRDIPGLTSCTCIVLAIRPSYREMRTYVAVGARGYLSFGTTTEQFSLDIARAVSGDLIIDPALAAHSTSGQDRVSDREVDILGALADGYSAQQIALQQHLALGTVRNHISSAMAKLDAHSCGRAVHVARSAGLI